MQSVEPSGVTRCPPWGPDRRWRATLTLASTLVLALTTWFVGYVQTRWLALEIRERSTLKLVKVPRLLFILLAWPKAKDLPPDVAVREGIALQLAAYFMVICWLLMRQEGTLEISKLGSAIGTAAGLVLGFTLAYLLHRTTPYR